MSAVLFLIIIILLLILGIFGYMLFPNVFSSNKKEEVKDNTDSGKKEDVPPKKEEKIADAAPDANNIGTQIFSGQNLLAGQYIKNGNFKLIYQSNGDLIYFSGTSQIWHSNTANKTANKMSFNGNINVIDNSNTTVYKTSVSGGTVLEISTSGELSIQDSKKGILWTANSGNSGNAPSGPAAPEDTGCTGINARYNYVGDTILNDKQLNQCEGLQNSNKQFKLVMQSDGNLVAYDTNSTNPKAIWASNTVNKGSGPYIARLQYDGNLAVVASGNNTIWSANPPNVSGTVIKKLEIDDAGRVNLLYSDYAGHSNVNYWHS